MLSPFQQYVHHADGRITLKDFPNVTLEVIQEQGRATGRDLERELGLPTYFEEWEVLAQPTASGLSRRRIQFVLMDESPTRLPGHYRYQPRAVTLPTTCFLEFAHRGFRVGVVHAFALGFAENRDDLQGMGIDLPADIEGDCILGWAQLFYSKLADKVWQGAQRGILSHACPLVYRENIEREPVGSGRLVEVSLVSDDNPGCQNARVLKTWSS